MVVDLDSWSERMLARWAPLRDQCAFAAQRGDETVGYREQVPFEVGSAFKAFVAAEFAHQIPAGRLDPEMQLTVQPVDRVDSSLVVAAIPDGGSISLQEAAEAMIGVSDNTATDLVLRAVGPDSVRGLIGDLGMSQTSIPDSTRSIYERFRIEPDWRPVACMTTMDDLVRFYQATVGDRVMGDATERFLDLMQQEDLLQGAAWPAGVTCFRKSGSVEPPPLFALGMAGAFVDTSGGEVTSFAFALNVDFPEDAAYEDSPLEPIARVFSEGLRLGLHELAGEA
ncbi:MAG TPA: serine hydrolase [Thermomicrobiales bacterium]|nr:serine hydrolase [Thermomicrobiales bacterium]